MNSGFRFSVNGFRTTFSTSTSTSAVVHSSSLAHVLMNALIIGRVQVAGSLNLLDMASSVLHPKAGGQ